MNHLGIDRVCVVIASAVGGSPALAESGGASLMLRADAADGSAPSRPEFGDRWSWYWTALAAVGLHAESTDAGAYLGLGTFLTDKFEFNFGASGWHFWQDGDDAGGVNPVFGFRYHFTPKNPVDFYLDAGIGLLFTTDDVPADGESVNFTPRAGAGALFRLGDGGTRLDVGVGWRHISTASTTGSGNNPARDGVMIYAGLVFPF